MSKVSKRTAGRSASRASSSSARAVVNILRGLSRAGGVGAKKRVAHEIGASPSTFSNLLSGKTPLHELTLAALALVESTKAAKFEEWPVLESMILDGVTYERRQNGDEEIITWRVG